MSRGMTFMVLRKSSVKSAKELADRLVKEYEDRMSSDEVSNAVSSRDKVKHPRFLCSEEPGCEIVDSETGIAYNVAVENTFQSVAYDLRETFVDRMGMDPYSPWKSQIVINETDAKAMLVAANYVLLGKYDRDIERVMDNMFVEPMGSMCEAYRKWEYLLMFPNDNWSSDGDDGRDALESLRATLMTFLYADDSEMYELVLEVWG